MSISEKMSPTELRASIGLASIYGLRMLGLFLILPVFAIYATTLPGGDNRTLVGLTLGIYGLTQAILQLPFGMASDRFGRKRVIYFGLALFALGSFVAGSAHDLPIIMIGRAIQGAGAISAAVTALLADLTREEHRTKAMALIGSSIGMTFAVSLVAGPALYRFIGIPGIFDLTGVLAILAVLVIAKVVPDPQGSHFHSDAETVPARLKDVVRHPQLLRLNFGIFSLHAAQMAMFIVIPFTLKTTGGLDEQHHWQVYLPVMVAAFALMIPAIIYGEKRAKLKQVFVTAIALLLLVELGMTQLQHSFWGVVAMLVGFFIAFNILEASLPSMISKIAPARSKGTAMGVYNTSQSLGLFAGGAVGGYLSHTLGSASVFAFGAVLMAVWLALAVTMEKPPAVRTKMYHLPPLTSAQAEDLTHKLLALAGVREAAVVLEEGAAYLKVDMNHWDEAQANQLIEER
ncbi:MAG: MFS transporter [Burkholderiales bacterium]